VTGSLPKRYARALFQLAREAGSEEAVGEELARALATFQEPRLRMLLLSPAIEKRARLDTTRKVIDGLRVSEVIGNLIALLAERDRLTILADVVRWYDQLLDDALGRARVAIRSAAPLRAGEKTELLDLARQLTGRREVIASTEVDPELLGGIVVDVGGTIYDGSVRTQLARLSKQMAEAKS
jgi:F-type H+-transporting ATPase subunit delta